ncbi:MAG: hypothetical protein J6V98_03210 [Bacteroidales bacterium]|nr:hypothetical protein [Bacteroidales bacterium]
MKKSLIIIVLLLLGGSTFAQYYYVPLWQGPTRGYIAGGYVQRSGVPDFKEYGGDALKPDQFAATPGFMASLGVDLETSSTGLAFGPYVHLDYFTDGWTARFNSELPSDDPFVTGHTYSHLNDYEYIMSCSYIGGTFGAAAYYHIGSLLEVGLGVGIFLTHALGTTYSANTYLHATGEQLDYHDAAPFILESTAVSNPVHVGLEGRFDISYFVNENLYIGLQARYDAAMLHCSIDESPNTIGSSMQCSDNDRPRIVALLTIGSYFH